MLKCSLTKNKLNPHIFSLNDSDKGKNSHFLAETMDQFVFNF